MKQDAIIGASNNYKSKVRVEDGAVYIQGNNNNIGYTKEEVEEIISKAIIQKFNAFSNSYKADIREILTTRVYNSVTQAVISAMENNCIDRLEQSLRELKCSLNFDEIVEKITTTVSKNLAREIAVLRADIRDDYQKNKELLDTLNIKADRIIEITRDIKQDTEEIKKTTDSTFDNTEIIIKKLDEFTNQSKENPQSSASSGNSNVRKSDDADTQAKKKDDEIKQEADSKTNIKGDAKKDTEENIEQAAKSDAEQSAESVPEQDAKPKRLASKKVRILSDCSLVAFSVFSIAAIVLGVLSFEIRNESLILSGLVISGCGILLAIPCWIFSKSQYTHKGVFGYALWLDNGFMLFIFGCIGEVLSVAFLTAYFLTFISWLMYCLLVIYVFLCIFIFSVVGFGDKLYGLIGLLVILLHGIVLNIMGSVSFYDISYEYDVNKDGTVTITKISCRIKGDIVIPSELDGKIVTGIGIDECVGGHYNSKIYSIIIPDSVTSIGESAFSSCYALTTITIGSNVTSIGGRAFDYCSNLASITVTEGNTKYHSAGNCLIETESKILIRGCKTSMIPEDGSVTIIGANAFQNCNELTSITIPNSVTSIGEYAFWSCDSLVSIMIPDSVTSIGVAAFSHCEALKSITIPDSVNSIGGQTFKDCDSLTNIIIPNGVTSIEYLMFEDCDSLTNITIPNSVKSIGSNAFKKCKSLFEITYGGTKAQWDSINKDTSWDYHTRDYVVYCTDGQIEKQKGENQ